MDPDTRIRIQKDGSTNLLKNETVGRVEAAQKYLEHVLRCQASSPRRKINN